MSGSRKVFVRDATGFVRQVSVLDSLFANIGFMSLPLGLLTFIIGPQLFPGGDLISATVLATALSVCSTVMYMLFTWTMPRSGGDYVWVSRLANPVLGFVINFNLTFWYVLFGGVVTNWVTTLAISPGLLVLGQVTANPSLTQLGTVLSQSQNVIIIGLVVTAVNVLVMAKGVKAIFTLNNILIIFSLIGYAVTFWLLATNSVGDFMNDFNAFSSVSYNNIIAAAHQSGYSTQGDLVIGTLGLMPFIFGTTGYGMISCYFSGEFKAAKKNAFYGMVGSVVLCGAILAVLGGLALRDFGYDFLGSITQLAYTGSTQYPFPVPPFFYLFVSLLTNNPIILWFLVLSYVAATFTALPATYMLTTRNIFAWSFDRTIPSKFSQVNEKIGSPIYAIAVCALIEILGLVSYTYISSFTGLVAGAGLAQIISFIVVAVLAILLPLKKQFYENSPAKMGGRIPVISIVGTISLIFYLIMEYFYITNPLYGATSPLINDTIAFSIILPAIIFGASYYSHKSKGLNILDVFKQIPPE